MLYYYLLMKTMRIINLRKKSQRITRIITKKYKYLPVTVRLLKQAPTHAKTNAGYNIQRIGVHTYVHIRGTKPEARFHIY